MVTGLEMKDRPLFRLTRTSNDLHENRQKQLIPAGLAGLPRLGFFFMVGEMTRCVCVCGGVIVSSLSEHTHSLRDILVLLPHCKYP